MNVHVQQPHLPTNTINILSGGELPSGACPSLVPRPKLCTGGISPTFGFDSLVPYGLGYRQPFTSVNKTTSQSLVEWSKGYPWQEKLTLHGWRPSILRLAIVSWAGIETSSPSSSSFLLLFFPVMSFLWATDVAKDDGVKAASRLLIDSASIVQTPSSLLFETFTSLLQV